MNIQEIEHLIKELGQPAYRAVQIFEWLHQRFPSNPDEAFSFAAMDNLPKNLREELEKRCYITDVKIADKLTAKDGTVKFLLTMGVNQDAITQTDVQVESVLMEYSHGRSLCISTQAGCRMGCYFCATGESGLIRNISAGEMCMQVYAAGDVRNIVLMGCGEPLDNFDATMRFVELITHPKGAGIGQRHITLSTCGLVPEIHALAQRRLQINLAVSLHGPDDATRQALMPIARRYSISELIAACREYADTTHRRITFEYALVEGVNDSPAQARALARLIKGMLCHVNLIPVNQAANSNKPNNHDVINKKPLPSFSPTKRPDALAFAAILEQAKIPATVRRTIGAEVNAACGQLRAKASNTKHVRSR